MYISNIFKYRYFGIKHLQEDMKLKIFRFNVLYELTYVSERNFKPLELFILCLCFISCPLFFLWK